MGDHPLRPPSHHRLGEPLPHQLTNDPQAHLQAPRKAFNNCGHVAPLHHAVLAPLSRSYSPPAGRLLTCYSPVRQSHHRASSMNPLRLACVKPAASVRPEPGSNSPLYSSSYKRIKSKIFELARPSLSFIVISKGFAMRSSVCLSIGQRTFKSCLLSRQSDLRQDSKYTTIQSHLSNLFLKSPKINPTNPPLVHSISPISMGHQIYTQFLAIVNVYTNEKFLRFTNI